MTKSGMNLQDSFLNQVRKENTEIMLMLLDGTRLNGYVRGFDNFTVIMNVRGSQHLIYKHAIAQIVSRRITHGEGEREGGHGASPEATPTGAPGETPQAAPAPQEGAPRREREGGYREREGGHREGGPREGAPRREREEGGHRDNGPREGSHREGGPREGGPRREREESAQSNKPKFNTIDFSSIKIDQEKKD